VAATDYVGKVVRIGDGDTFTSLVDREELRIRLAEIDTPEKGQPYGKRARQALADLIYGKTIRVVEVDHDRYGRVVGRVYAGSIDVNAASVISRGVARRKPKAAASVASSTRPWPFATCARAHPPPRSRRRRGRG
jgi:endonuclease YncB( thermonuclease family)